MPGYDRTGPMGGGAMTGRGAGRCGGNRMQTVRFGGRGGGMGRGFGRGGGGWCPGPGRGWRGRFDRAGYGDGYGNIPARPVTSPVLRSDTESEKRFLQNQTDLMTDQLEEIRRRLDELEGKETG